MQGKVGEEFGEIRRFNEFANKCFKNAWLPDPRYA